MNKPFPIVGIVCVLCVLVSEGICEDLLPRNRSLIANTGFLVPAVANAPGLNGAFFRTRVKLYNPTDHGFSINVVVMDGVGGEVLKSINIGSKNYLVWDNFLSEVMGYSGGGALLFRSVNGAPADKFTLSCEVYTDSFGGRYTTSVPTIETIVGSPPSSPPSYSNVGIRIDSQQRMNVGCVNPNVTSASVTMLLYDETAQLLTSLTLDMPPFSWKQVPLSASVNNGNIVWSAPNGTFPYVVSVNNTSNDGTLEMAQAYVP
jgi:hypothetical protein